MSFKKNGFISLEKTFFCPPTDPSWFKCVVCVIIVLLPENSLRLWWTYRKLKKTVEKVLKKYFEKIGGVCLFGIHQTHSPSIFSKYFFLYFFFISFISYIGKKLRKLKKNSIFITNRYSVNSEIENYSENSVDYVVCESVFRKFRFYLWN